MCSYMSNAFSVNFMPCMYAGFGLAGPLPKVVCNFSWFEFIWIVTLNQIVIAMRSSVLSNSCRSTTVVSFTCRNRSVNSVALFLSVSTCWHREQAQLFSIFNVIISWDSTWMFVLHQGIFLSVVGSGILLFCYTTASLRKILNACCLLPERWTVIIVYLSRIGLYPLTGMEQTRHKTENQPRLNRSRWSSIHNVFLYVLVVLRILFNLVFSNAC